MSNRQVWRAASMPVSSHGSETKQPFPGNRERSVTDSSILAPKYPEPFMSIPAQSLVQDDSHGHASMVRKENKYNRWQDRYLVLHKGCMYYYKDSSDKSSKGQFSLGGYRMSSAPERSKFQWTFKLSHIQPEKRTYYFAAHSEKDLKEWFQKIKESMDEYCEPLGTRSGFSQMKECNDSSSSGSSGEDCDALKYDYPIVDPPDLNLAKAKLLEMQKDWPATTPPSQTSTEPEYCLAPEFDWSAGLHSSPPAPPPRVQTDRQSHSNTASSVRVATPLVVLKSGKTSVDISSLLPRRVSPETVEGTCNSKPRPLPKPRFKRSPSPLGQARASRSRPTSPPNTPEKPLHRFASDSNLLSSTGKRASLERGHLPSQAVTSCSEEEDDDEEYLKILPDDLPAAPFASNTSPSKPRLSTLERMRPEGKSFHGKQTEIYCQDVLPPSAKRLDIDKSIAIPMIEGHNGMYILHKSSRGDINQCLSMCNGDKVRHFLIFKNEDGYALHPDGQRSQSIEELIRHYYTNPLPNQQSATLREPYH